MKKRVLSILAMATTVSVLQAAPGDDITAKFLKNADFSQDTPVTGRICTYDYDMNEDNGATLFGQQAVTGWNALNLSDNIKIMQTSGDPAREDGANARAAGVFAIGAYNEDGDHTAELGGAYYVPDFNAAGEEATGQALGLITVWSSTIQYTQTVTLPAGAYTIQIPTWNAAGTGSVAKNLCGFIADNGTAYVIDKTSWAADAEWMMDEVTFMLDEETTGVISLGYASSNAGSGSMPHLFFDCIKIIEADAKAIIKAQVDIVKEEQLLPLIQAGEELGVDTKYALSVYDNPEATMDEVLKAIETQKANNASSMTDFTDFFINNAHFAQGTPLDNGVCTYDYDMEKNETTYYGMQPIQSWNANTPTDNTLVSTDSTGGARTDGKNAGASGLFAVGSPETVWLGSKGDVVPATKANGSTEGNVFGFISVWGKSSYYSQNVTLPAGSYTITIPTYNERGTGTVTKNLCGFIASDGTEYLAETTTFPEKKWSNETIKFTLEEETDGMISIGYTAANAGSGSMPHLFIDEFTLMFNGKTDIDPSLIALRGAVNSASNYLYSDDPYYNALTGKLQEAVNAAQDLVNASSSDSEANTAAATDVNNLISEIRASMAKYAAFEAFINGKMADAVAAYDGNDEMQNISDDLSDMQSTYQSAYEEGEYTSDEIDAIINGFDALIMGKVDEIFKAAVADNKEHNINITCLFPDKNLGYANSNVEGWANETGTSAFLSRVQTAEVWNQSQFNVHQTLADMPAGVYEIKANGYYRSAANVDNYAEFEEGNVIGRAYMYAGLNKVLMHNVAEYATEVADNHSGDLGNGLYVANTNNDAHYAFYEQGEAENSVKTVLLEEGDLTFGVMGEELEGNAWVVWGGFTVTYKGNVGASDIIDEQITALQDEASRLMSDSYVSLVEKADNDLNDAIGAGDNAKGETVSNDAKQAAIVALQAAIAYAKTCEAAVAKWEAQRDLYTEIYNNAGFESDDETLANLIEKDPEEGIASVEAIEEIVAGFKPAWSQFFLGQSEVKEGMAAATIDAPFEMSGIILNHSFEEWDEENGQLGLKVWNVERRDGDTGIKENANATYTMEGCDGDFLFNTWNQGTVGYAINQDVCLPAGYYTLKCVVATDAENVVKVHAGEREAEAICVGKETAVEVSLDFGCEGGMINLGAAGVDTWYKADNFQLFYLGTTAPTAIDAVAQTGKVAIFNLNGQQQSRLQKGINIVRKADGHVQKLMVK